MPRTPDGKKDRDWKHAAEMCLTTTLDRLREVASESADAKTLESIAKTVGDIVGVAGYAGGGNRTTSQGDDDE